MPRFKLHIEFDGSRYHGLQRQDGDIPTVEGELTAAFEKLTGHAPEAFAMCGRTDKGVHARNLIVHIDGDSSLPAFKIKGGLNAHLPNDIAVLAVEIVEPDTFHARFSAYERSYEYLLLNRKVASPLWHNRAALERQPLDVALMKKAAAKLVGEHDFSAFRSSECQAKSPITTLHELTITQNGDMLHFTLRGTKFLHNMVRILVGTLVDIGKGKLDIDTIDALLHTPARTAAGATMPACGLYFTGALYPAYTCHEKA